MPADDDSLGGALPIRPLDYDREITTATEAVQKALGRFTQVVEWASEDLAAAPPESRLHASLTFLTKVMKAEHDYDMTIARPMTQLAAQMLLDAHEKGALEDMPDDIRETLERMTNKDGIIEGVGRFEDIPVTDEPKPPKPDTRKRDFDGNYE